MVATTRPFGCRRTKSVYRAPSASSDGSGRGARAGSGGDRVEARGQPLSERKQPAMAEVEEPGVYAGMRATAKRLDASAQVRLANFPWTSSALNASAVVAPGAIAVMA